MSAQIEEYIKNPIKRYIISLLMKHTTLKYSELMPEDVDNVLFNYHLQHLVKTGFVIKDENFYSLSPEGLVETSHISYEGVLFQKFVCRFRIYVIENNKVLMHERKIGPWKGDTSAIWGKMVYGEGIEGAAVNQLKEQTGLIATDLKCVGSVRTIITNDNKDILDDSIYYVCVVKEFNGELFEQDLNGNLLKWYEFEKALELEKSNRGSGEKTVEILERFSKKDFSQFVFEEQLFDESL